VLVRSWSKRIGAALASSVALSCLVVPLTASAASAATVPSLPLTQTAARDFGNDGPADEAAVQASVVAVGADGRVVFYDRRARQLRAIDPTTHVVTALAGTGSSPAFATCVPDTSQAPTATALPVIAQLWVVANGDIYAWVSGQPNCSQRGDIYRLAVSDGMWHLALKNPGTCCFGLSGLYRDFAVDTAGNLLAWDPTHYVIRRFAAGGDPNAVGTVVAGVSGAPGSTFDGEGGPATAAHLGDLNDLVLSADGSLAFTTNATVRRVGTDGVISTVAGNGTTAPSNEPGVDVGLAATAARMTPIGLLVSPSDSTHFFVLNSSGTYSAWQSFTVGGALAKAVGPTEVQSYTGPKCVSTAGAASALSGGQLLQTCGFGVYSWPSDGSAALADGSRVAGIDDVAGFDVSPDGVTLDHAFLPVGSIAQATDGHFVIAASGAIRTLTGLSATATLGTLTTQVPNAARLAYAGDGTLYASTSGNPSQTGAYAVTAAGVVTRVLGGGSSAPVEDAAGTSIGDIGATALDAADGVMYFVVGTIPQVWGLTLSTGLIHRVLGNGGSGTLAEGMPAVNAPLVGAPSTLAVNPVTHALYLGYGTGTMYRVDSDGTFHNAGPVGGNAMHFLGALPNGVMLTQGVHGVETLAADGTRADVLQGLTAVSGVSIDGRVIGPPSFAGSGPAREAGGLLTVSASAVPAPTFPEAAPTVEVTPGAGTLTVAVTPAAGTTQRLDVYVRQVPGDGAITEHSYLTTVPNDGTGTPWQSTYATFHVSGGSFPITAAHQYVISVVPSLDNLTTFAAAAPVVVQAQPLPDTTAPAAPVITATPNGIYVYLQITVPADADLHHVVWFGKSGSAPPASFEDATAGTTVYGSTTVNVDADPGRPFSLKAIAYDNSGNASVAATATRAAPTLAAGTAASNVRFAAGSGCSWVLPGSSFVRYASGTTAPAGPADGTSQGTVSTAWGDAACVPVASGAKVAVSLFAWTDWSMTQFTRTSFVLTGGVSGDSAALAATSIVNYGARPVVSTTLTRTFATGGSQRIAGQPVDLYRRPVGTSTWVKFGTATTNSTGTAAFTVPVPTGHVDYQVRSAGIVSTTVLSTLKRTSVKQTLTLAQSATSVRHGYAVTLSGVIAPKRAARVYLQRYVSGKWVNLTYVNSTTAGAYKFLYKPPAAGTYVLRTSLLATTTLLANSSVSRTVKAT
jgi:hypothetical protein